MPITREYAVKCLRRAVGRDDVDFREGQWEAIDGVLNYRRQLVVQRTGWGKSMIYFLASMFLREQGRGMTLLISPLISLMRNQVAAAERVGIRCHTINSTNPEEWDGIRAEILSGCADILIVSPERLANDTFRTTILEPIMNQIGLLVVDEAHCVSDWGHDFRPDYKKISQLLRHLPQTTPVLATTATATNRVIEDIKGQLGDAVEVSRGSLVRKSLFLQNIRLASQESRFAWLAATLGQRIQGSGIVYALTIRDAETLAHWLRLNGIAAYAYCGKVLPPMDMDKMLRAELESRPGWMSATKDDDRAADYRVFLEDLLLVNRVKTLVATSALSMGFDKPDLAFVIHYQRPKSVVDYYQQVGRAGRGIDSAYGVLLNGEEDDRIADFFIRNAFPSGNSVRQLLDAVVASPEGLSKPELLGRLNIKSSKVEQMLKFIMSGDTSPIFKDGPKYRATQYVRSYRIPFETIQRLTEIRYGEVRTMDAYVKTAECLMSFLCRELDSPMEGSRCDHCRNCRPQEALPTEVDARMEQSAAEFLNRTQILIEPRARWADATSAQRRFPEVRNTIIPPTLRMECGCVLSQYGVGEWGRLVQKGKYASCPAYFDDRLVTALEELIRTMDVSKAPFWIVPVPSRRNNALVGDFARRVASVLGVPFSTCLKKVKDTPPQKNMENGAFQQDNIIDAFAVEGTVPSGACVLVDDMVDSRWTLTIAAAVLRAAGVPSVTPVALSDSSNEGD